MENKARVSLGADSNYEMDDYELLIARHHLIQQQLENIDIKFCISKLKVLLLVKYCRMAKIVAQRSVNLSLNHHFPCF